MNFNFNFIFGYVMENSWKVWMHIWRYPQLNFFGKRHHQNLERIEGIAKEKNTNSHILKGNPDCQDLP